jgi:hypothetical protein
MLSQIVKVCFHLCQESMSAQTSMARPNVPSPHVRQPFGLCRDGITHLIELMKGYQHSRVNGMTLSEPLAIQPESCRFFPAHPVFMLSVPWPVVRNKERLGMIIMIVFHAARSRFAVGHSLLLAGYQPASLAIPIDSPNNQTERGNKNQSIVPSINQSAHY